jgi:hypothetical protein
MTRGWTPEETDLAYRSETFEQYVEAGGLREITAWRGKRNRLGLTTSADIPVVLAPPVLPDSSEYDAIEDYYQAVKRITQAKIVLVDKPTTEYWTAPDSNWTGIVFLGDIHVGGLIDYGQLERDLSSIEDAEGLYVVGMGDYSDNFERAGKLLHAMSGDTVAGSDDQELLVRHVLGRCGKWLAVLAGNHDDWGSGEGVRRLARSLGGIYVSQAGCSFKITLGNQRYNLYLKHQYTGQSRISTSNDGRRFWTEWPDFENADITVLAHLHEPNTHSVERKGQTVSHLRGGTYKTVDPWARKGGYSPAYGPSMILLNPNEHEVIPFHGPQWRWGVAMLKGLRDGSVTLEGAPKEITAPELITSGAVTASSRRRKR